MSEVEFGQTVQAEQEFNQHTNEKELHMNAPEQMKEIASYSPTLAALATLEKDYKGVVFDVTTTDGMKDAKQSYKDINTHSITLEAARVAEKAASLAYGKFVDSEAKRIAERLDALRLPIKAQIEVETKRVEREKEESDRLAAEKFNREQAELKATEEAKLAEQRAEIARQQKEMEDAARASRLKIEEEERAHRAKIEEEQRAARLIQEEQDRIARLAREAEEAKLRAERERLAEEARIIAEAKRKEQEAEEAKQREIQRQQNELLDGNAMLTLFKTRYGSRQEFAGIMAAIDFYFEG